MARVPELQTLDTAIADALRSTVGQHQAIDTALRFASADPDKLIRTLRVFIDGGRRPIADASLGSANLLYVVLKMLEYEQLVAEGERDHTILALEEPEAHLHPTLQRLVFRQYLASRVQAGGEEPLPLTTVLMTTHSPHIASVAPLASIVMLRVRGDGRGTTVRSAATLEFSDQERSDLERYIDVNRADIMFAKSVVIVEGDAERYLVPALARSAGVDLDEQGVAVCSINGTNFAPYLRLLGPQGLDVPSVSTDRLRPEDGGPLTRLGPARVANQMLPHLVDEATLHGRDLDDVLALAPEHGVFLNTHTLEIDLFLAGARKRLRDHDDATGRERCCRAANACVGSRPRFTGSHSFPR